MKFLRVRKFLRLQYLSPRIYKVDGVGIARFVALFISQSPNLGGGGGHLGGVVRHCTSEPFDSTWLPGDQLICAHGVGPLQPEISFRNETFFALQQLTSTLLACLFFPHTLVQILQREKVDALSKLSQRTERTHSAALVDSSKNRHRSREENRSRVDEPSNEDE